MGTRVFKTVRYRGRYYCFYNRWDSYPERLGNEIQSEIPADPEAYAKWLAEQRDWYEILHKELEEYLSVRRYNAGEEPSKNGRSVAHLQLDSRNNKSLPSYMPEDRSYHDALWDYIVDLDREVFTINDSAHMKLDRVPKRGWIQALIKADRHDYVILPGLVPKGCVTDLVLKIEPTPVEPFNFYNSLALDIVNPKVIEGIPLSQRHGPFLSARIFRMFQENQKNILKDLLLGWNADDLCFREIVIAILCIASPGKNLSLVRSHRVLDSLRAGYSDILSRNRTEKVSPLMYDTSDDDGVEHNRGELTAKIVSDGIETSIKKETSEFGDLAAEFVAHFGVGCHLQGNPPGCSAAESIYWFEGVLVAIAVQLTQTGAVARNVTRMFQYHQQNYARMTINAVIISIEHVILMTIDSHGKIHHTEPLCIFAFDTHGLKDPSARYPAAYLEALENHVRNASARKAMKRRHAAEMAEAVKKRKEKQTWGKAALNTLEENVDAIYRPEQDLERAHSKEYSEERARNPSKKNLAAKCEKEIYESRQTHVPDSVTESSFLSLIYFLEVTARQRMCTTQGRLPTELYQIIIANLPDTETYRTCMDVSTLFRDLCQQQLRVMDDCVIFANGASSKNDNPNMNEAQNDTSFLKAFHLPTGIVREMQSPPARYGLDAWHNYCDSEYFRVVLGSQRDRRTILLDMDVCLKPVWMGDSKKANAASTVPSGDSGSSFSE